MKDMSEKLFNPFQSSVAFRRETSHLIYIANQWLVSINGIAKLKSVNFLNFFGQ